MIDKENRPPNLDFSYINSVLSLSIVDFVTAIPSEKTKWNHLPMSKDSLRKDAKSYVQILNNLCDYRAHLGRLSFHEKVRIAQVILSILRFLLLFREEMKLSVQNMESIVNNATYLIVGLQ